MESKIDAQLVKVIEEEEEGQGTREHKVAFCFRLLY
jgi:hypothetical protein